MAGVNRLPASTSLVLAGGILATGGFNQTFGTLTLSGSSSLDLGSGASIVHFAASNLLSWSGTLSIANWTGDRHRGGGADQILFGTSATSLTLSELGEILFAGFPIGAAILPTGEIVPAAAPLPLRGDLDQDARITVADIASFMNALSDLHGYQSANSLTDPALTTIADVNGDGRIDNSDLQSLIGLVANTIAAGGSGNGSSTSNIHTVPEPSSVFLAIVGAVALLTALRRSHYGNRRTRIFLK